MPEYEQAVKDSWIYEELYKVRNVRPSFHNPLGFYGGLLYTGFFTCMMNGEFSSTVTSLTVNYQAHLALIWTGGPYHTGERIMRK